MNNTKLKQLILKVLKEDERLWNEDKTDLNQTLLLDLVENIDETVIDLLLQEKELREKFFVKIKDVFVFKTNDFRFFMEENKIDNSYTSYKNRIGLTDGKKFLKDTNDVVLDFPYKDCVLEGGQSTEEGTDTEVIMNDKLMNYELKKGKRKEIFFNSVLAHDEIDRLFDHKALTNWKRFDKNGELSMVNDKNDELSMVNYELKRKEDGTLAENLIIKGNNLLALHSLKKQFAGKIKLIYIDPPYNTGNDGFKYNDNFNHSTWLTFMKNRLEVARELLRDDGVIFVQCDDNEQAYLKVLMDEVFGRENFVNNIIPVMNPRGRQEASYPIAKSHEYLIIYSKKESMATFFNVNKKEYTENENIYRLLSLRKSGNASSRKDRPNMYYPIYYSEEYNDINIYKSEHYNIEILPIKTSDGSDGRWRWKKENVQTNKHLLVVKKNSKGIYDIYEKNYTVIDGENKGEKIQTFIKDKNIINDKAKEHLESLFNNKIFDYPKSEYLLKLVLDFTTQPNDIVLDYHLGSGTTCAVAHKMGRQYIGIEQMDYVETIACERMKKVIEGEQGGISNTVNWQGGGDFIYFELAKWNETAKEKIQEAKSLEELEKFFDEMYERYFLNYNLKIKEFKEKVLQEENFRNLSLDEQKKIFVAMLDNNQMYVNKTEMADKKFEISDDDQKMTDEFYR